MQDETSVMHWYLSQECVLADIALLTDIKHDEVYWCLWLMFIGSTTWLLLSLNFQSSLDDKLKYIKAGHILWWRFLVLKNKITEQATEISFRWRVAGLSLRVMSSVIWDIHIERSQLRFNKDASQVRCFGYVPPGGGPGHAGEIFLNMSGNICVFPQIN